jgi:DNA-binding transcriptional LysR family regulator
VFQTAAHALLPQALSILATEYPQLRVEASEREPEVGLFEVSARDFDLAIAEQYPGHTRAHRPDLDRAELCTDHIRLATPHADSTRGRIQTFTDAHDLPWVMEPHGTVSRNWAVQLCRAAGFEPDVRFETADLMAHIRLIRSGNAVGLLPDLVWAGEQPSVRLVDLPGRPQRTIFTSARRTTAGRPGIRASRSALARAVELIETSGPDAHN